MIVCASDDYRGGGEFQSAALTTHYWKIEGKNQGAEGKNPATSNRSESLEERREK